MWLESRGMIRSGFQGPQGISDGLNDVEGKGGWAAEGAEPYLDWIAV